MSLMHQELLSKIDHVMFQLPKPRIRYASNGWWICQHEAGHVGAGGSPLEAYLRWLEAPFKPSGAWRVLHQ